MIMKYSMFENYEVTKIDMQSYVSILEKTSYLLFKDLDYIMSTFINI
jgi:hypothetical protein